MARNLVALKFQAGIHTTNDEAKGHKTGHAKYPDFNQVSIATRRGMDWCEYIDAFGIGMQADKSCGHKEHTPESPLGEQCCVVAVEEAFANEALMLFPTELTELTEAEFEAFYNGKAHAHELAESVDKDVLDAISQKESFGLAVPEKADALNVNSDARGVRKNHDKLWVDKKVKAGVTVLDRKNKI